jgi:hypothetical protein
MGLVLKTSVGVTSPGVRIPLGPLVAMRTHFQESRVLRRGFFNAAVSVLYPVYLASMYLASMSRLARRPVRRHF